MQQKPDVEAVFEFVGFRKENVFEGYRPAHLVREDYLTTGMHGCYNLEDGDGEELRGTITFLSPEAYPASLWMGKRIAVYEGKTLIGCAAITNIFDPTLRKG